MVAYLNQFPHNYRFLKMPKFKHTTATYCACQPKKRKKSQREDPVRHQEEMSCNAAARQQLCVDNPERREQEQHIILKLIDKLA